MLLGFYKKGFLFSWVKQHKKKTKQLSKMHLLVCFEKKREEVNEKDARVKENTTTMMVMVVCLFFDR